MVILEILTLIFVVLKLTGSIDWSWFWVLCPLIPSALAYVLLFGMIFTNAGTRKGR